VKLLLIVAHPDDETFGCGSVLAHAAEAGVESVVICATRGELGEVSGTLPAGQDRSAPIEPDRLGEIRESELRAATALLGVATVDVLGWRDSGVDGDPAPDSLAAAATGEVAAALAARIDEIEPDIVIVPDGNDGHRDHVAMCKATLCALTMTSWRPARTYLWCIPRSLLSEYAGVAEIGTPDEAITTVVDTSRHLERRWAAMRAHATQRPPFDDMPADLQRRFLDADHFIRVDPRFVDETVESDWIPGA